MNKLKKILSIPLACMIFSSMLIGCTTEPADTDTSTADSTSSQAATSEEDNAGAEEFSYPMSYEGDPIEAYFTGFFGLHESFSTADDSPFHIGAEERTGVDFNWSYPTIGSDASQSLNLVLASSDLPQMVEVSSIAEVEILIADGVLIDLSPYLEQYAPNYWETLNSPEYEKIRKTLTTDEGNMGVFGAWREGDFGRTWQGLLVRQDILDEAGLELPETIADWEEVLNVMKEDYDMYMTFEGSKTTPLLASGFGAYGTFTWQNYVDDGTVYLAQMQPEWQEYMATMADWYQKGYIDPDVVTNADAEVQAKVANDQAGVTSVAMSRVTIFENAAIDSGNGHEWVGVPFPAEEEGGVACTAYLEDQVRTAGVGITTSATEEQIIAICRFMDYFYTEEGEYYINFGEEGVSHTRDDDGNLLWSEELTTMPEGLRAAAHIYSSAGGINPGAQLTEFVQSINTPSSVEAVEAWISNQEADDHLFPAGVSFTVEELEDKANQEAAIRTYIEETSYKFLTGEMDVNTEYETFLTDLESMGVNDVLAIYQAGYDRFLAR